MCKDSNDTVAREPYLSTLVVAGCPPGSHRNPSEPIGPHGEARTTMPGNKIVPAGGVLISNITVRFVFSGI